jgi:hypothetical protein
MKPTRFALLLAGMLLSATAASLGSGDGER